MIGSNRLVTLSTDKSVRVVNLATMQLDQVIKTGKDYFSGCQFDWNTAILGGHSKSLDILDIRSKRLITSKMINIPVLQICEMLRISDNEV